MLVKIMRHNTASFFVTMNEQISQTEKKESLKSPEIIDGRVWLRQIFRESKPRYLWKLEDDERLQYIRKAISETEVAFFKPESTKPQPAELVLDIKRQRKKDIYNACPSEASDFIKERR